MSPATTAKKKATFDAQRIRAGIGSLGLRPRGGLAVSSRRLNHRARTGSR